MKSFVRICMAALFLFLGFIVWSEPAVVETKHLVVRDLTATLSGAALSDQANEIEALLGKELAFWEFTDAEWTFGKLSVELDEPQAGGAYFTVFEIRKEGKTQVRTIHIVGFKEQPMELAHKITHALFPNDDKLMRNMMGIPVEMRFGNPLSFPLCGFSPHAWVLAQRGAGRFIHIKDLGPKHEDWGMAFKDGLPVVTDPALQHLSYAFAGSFGDFLVEKYGSKKLKEFFVKSSTKDRPWADVFGKDVETLESEWLSWLSGFEKTYQDDIAYLTGLIKANPAKARHEAEKRAREKMIK